jgi:hypothetical protein
MVPVDMCFQDLAAARIMYMRTAGIGNIRRFIYDSAMAGIINTSRNIIHRRLFGYDGILKPGTVFTNLYVRNSFQKKTVVRAFWLFHPSWAF